VGCHRRVRIFYSRDTCGREPIKIYLLVSGWRFNVGWVLQEIQRAAVASRFATRDKRIVVQVLKSFSSPVEVLQNNELRVNTSLEVLLKILFLNSLFDIELVIQVLETGLNFREEGISCVLYNPSSDLVEPKT
jgi:hypothetical protein